MKATIYIPDEKYKLYEDAREKLGDSISATFLRCLERELEQQRQAVGRIVVTVTENERSIKKAFEGRWIIGNATSGERFDFSEDEIVRHSHGFEGYSVAVTKAGRIVVLQHMEEQVIFQVFEDYEDFAEAMDDVYPRFPTTLELAVAAELGIDRVEDLDI
jgi:hypothetical protein